jgi:hypothetical protein
MPKTTVKENFKELVSRLDDYILEQDWPDSEDGREDFVSLACNLFEEIEFPDVEQLDFDLQAVDKLSPEYLQKVEELQQAEKTARALTVIEALLEGLRRANVMHGLTRPMVEAFKEKSIAV